MFWSGKVYYFYQEKVREVWKVMSMVAMQPLLNSSKQKPFWTGHWTWITALKQLIPFDGHDSLVPVNSLHLSVGKAPDPGDSFSVRTESASTVFQSTAEKRNYTQTPNNSINGKLEAVKQKGESVSSVKAKLDNKSGIDEKIKQECRQVLIKNDKFTIFFIFMFI